MYTFNASFSGRNVIKADDDSEITIKLNVPAADAEQAWGCFKDGLGKLLKVTIEVEE